MIGELFGAVKPHGACEVEDAEIAQCRGICLSITHAAPPNFFGFFPLPFALPHAHTRRYASNLPKSPSGESICSASWMMVSMSSLTLTTLSMSPTVSEGPVILRASPGS